MSIFFRIILGVIFGLLTSVVLSPALAALHDDESAVAPIASLVIIVAATALCAFAPTIRRAFGRGFLLIGVSFLALPFSAMMLAGRAANEVISDAASQDQAAAAVGAGAAGIAITGAATFVGLIAGAIFVIIGLVLALGGRRDVVIVERIG